MTAREVVYVASSWRNPDQPALVERLRAAGYEVYDFRHPEPDEAGFSWAEIDPGWEQWTPEEYLAALEHPRAVEGFGKDFTAMRRAGTFVLILPCGRSAHLELGWAVGAGRRTVVILNGAHEAELMVKLVDHLALDVDDAIAWLRADDVARTPHPARRRTECIHGDAGDDPRDVGLLGHGRGRVSADELAQALAADRADDVGMDYRTLLPEAERLVAILGDGEQIARVIEDHYPTSATTMRGTSAVCTWCGETFESAEDYREHERVMVREHERVMVREHENPDMGGWYDLRPEVARALGIEAPDGR